MITTAVIAAAGRGTRMGELAQDRPKHLIQVNGRPFLYYLLNNLKQAGFTKIILVTGYKAEVMEKFWHEIKNEFPVKLINQFELLGEDRYGSALPLQAAEKLVGNQNFVTVYGDNLYSANDLALLALDDDFNYIAGLKHSNPSRYGVLIQDQDNFLIKIEEKPKEFVGDIINTGLYKFTPEIFNTLKQIKISPRGEYELTDALSLLAQNKKVKVTQLHDYWFDFGRREDIAEVENFIKNDYSKFN